MNLVLPDPFLPPEPEEHPDLKRARQFIRWMGGYGSTRQCPEFELAALLAVVRAEGRAEGRRERDADTKTT